MIQHDTALHETTVTKAADHADHFAEQRAARARQRETNLVAVPDGHWLDSLSVRQVPQMLLDSALEAAQGDPNLLWFDADGSVWILNHRRNEKCISPACPACRKQRR